MLCCAFVCLVFGVSLSVLVYDCTYCLIMQRPENILCSAMSFWVASLGHCLSFNLGLGYQATRVRDPYVFVSIALRLQGHSLMARVLNGYQRCTFNSSCLENKPSYSLNHLPRPRMIALTLFSSLFLHCKWNANKRTSCLFESFVFYTTCLL